MKPSISLSGSTSLTPSPLAPNLSPSRKTSSAASPPRNIGQFPSSPLRVPSEVGQTSRLLSLSFGGESLLCQFSAEILFLLGNVLFVATGIDERVRTPLFHKSVLFFESEVVAMRTEENIARQ